MIATEIMSKTTTASAKPKTFAYPSNPSEEDALGWPEIIEPGSTSLDAVSRCLFAGKIANERLCIYF
ncbi:hypothetical protein VNO80_16295 [Phaseolus coccineus]|uniref:Uncharacterized protein n=1 Tax=Phaseolus coccineus TaxID=3886 RepID=A0AAN9MLV2_PHACN